MAKEYKILLSNGNSVTVYTSSLRGTAINAADCNTEYKKIKSNPDIYEQVKN